MHYSSIVLTEWKIVGAGRKILPTKHRNYNTIPFTSHRIEKNPKNENIIQNNSYETEISLTKNGNTLQNSKIVLTEWRIICAEHKIIAKKFEQHPRHFL